MGLILASASPRRKELLSLITKDFTVCEADFDEAAEAEADPRKRALKLACGKCRAVWARFPGETVIGCDTVVDCGGRVFEKPRSRREAEGMLRALSGGAHLVHTGVCIRRGAKEERFTGTTRVWFAEIPDGELESYLDTPEPYDKAGGYGIQGWAARFIPRIEGCYFNVMGLPVSSLYAALLKICEND
ncbi:MAG: Maf family protein [Oscillospiraceae bacterium]|nr:Maf family protein [Oscillospiraceae bacterium]